MTQIKPFANPQSLITTCCNALITATLAPECAVCSSILDNPIEGCVCRICWGSVRPITPPVCDSCGDPLPAPAGRCANCCAAERMISRSRAVGEYDGTLREIIHALKYGGRRSLAQPLAALMRARGAELLNEADCVVPVPLHWRREYSRGFNQARELARHLGPPVVEALTRGRHTRAQVELAASRRRANVADAFSLRQRWFRQPTVYGLKILLIDDVSTTGATLGSCARVLQDSGASEVFALTAARVPIRRRREPLQGVSGPR